jgi:hypothetical protein
VESGSFTFEFHVHVAAGRCHSWIGPLAAHGCSTEFLNERTLRVHCSDSHATAYAGWLLYQTAARKWGRVIAVTGAAEMNADAYRNPPAKFKTRKI